MTFRINELTLSPRSRLSALDVCVPSHRLIPAARGAQQRTVATNFEECILSIRMNRREVDHDCLELAPNQTSMIGCTFLQDSRITQSPVQAKVCVTSLLW